MRERGEEEREEEEGRERGREERKERKRGRGDSYFSTVPKCLTTGWSHWHSGKGQAFLSLSGCPTCQSSLEPSSQIHP